VDHATIDAPTRAQQLLATTSDLVWFADAAGIVLEANDAACALLGWDLEAGSVRSESAYTVASRAVLEVDAAPTLRGRTTWAGDLTLRSAAGDAVAASVVQTAHHDRDGHLVWVATVARDQRRAQALERELRHRATHDALTGLPNRDGFVAAASVALAHGPAAVVLCDLRDLKGLNETLGRAGGDQLLTLVADRLRSCLRDGDVAAHLSGGEFAILLPGVDDVEAVAIAERILAVLGPAHEVDGRTLHVSVSMGVATGTSGDLTVAQLIQHADMAVYLAKHDGRAPIERYDETAHRRVVERLQLRQDLVGALDRGELRLAYQPLVGLEDGHITGVEALLRWDHPDLGAVGPLRFVPLLEESGSIVEVGRWVLEEALRQLVVWDASLDRSLTVSVNVSALQLRPELVPDVATALAGAGIDPARLTLEITESAIVADLEGAVTLLEELRATGVRIALDDFGTGYSSLGSLQALPIDQLKIDRSFIQRVERTGDTAMVASICQMTAALGMRSVAEGIEVEQVADLLRGIGCETGQGYLWSRPVTPDVVTDLLGTPAARARDAFAGG
jgi:diguanylate cyclase (GGDEF)-like protein